MKHRLLDLNLNDLSETTLDGQGVFDILMRAVKTHLLEEYAAQRISADKYADVYLAAMQSVLTAAANVYIQQGQLKQQRVLVEQQLLSEKAQTETSYTVVDADGNPVLDASGNPVTREFEGLLGAQIKVHKAQEDAFVQDINLKVMKQYLDMFAVLFSQDNTLTIPTIVQSANTDKVLKHALTSIYGDLTIP